MGKRENGSQLAHLVQIHPVGARGGEVEEGAHHRQHYHHRLVRFPLLAAASEAAAQVGPILLAAGAEGVAHRTDLPPRQGHGAGEEAALDRPAWLLR